MKISIIGGAGKMGFCISKILLKRGLDPLIWDKDRQKLLKTQKYGIRIAESCEDAVKKGDVILLSVPIRDFEQVVKEISHYLRKGQLLIDISSVKEYTINTMHRYVHTATTIGVHPMFGPSTQSLEDQNIMLTPTTNEEARVAEYMRHKLDKMGAKTTIMTPKEHDQLMASVLTLPHLIALAAAETLLQTEREKLRQTAGPSLKTLMTLVNNVISQDPSLYSSIQMNLQSRNILKRFQKSIKEWTQIIGSRNDRRFVERMRLLRETRERKSGQKSQIRSIESFRPRE